MPIIKTAGKMPDIITALNTLKKIYGERATLSDIAKHLRAYKVEKAVKNQINDILEDVNK